MPGNRWWWVVLGITAVCLIWFSTRLPASLLTVTFCDVGQGDATLISLGWTQILVDQGPQRGNEYHNATQPPVVDCLKSHLPGWDRTIELVVLTHMDADHIGGLPAVTEHFAVSQVMLIPLGKETSTFWQLRAALLEEMEAIDQIMVPQRGDTLVWQQAVGPPLQLTVIHPAAADWDQRSLWAAAPQGVSAAAAPPTESTLSDVLPRIFADDESNNDRSIAIIVEYGHLSIALMGDVEEKGELALVSNQLIPRVEVLKAGHHGANASSTPALLATLQPEHVVVSSGQANRYGHPSRQVVSRVAAVGASIWRTDLQRTIQLRSNGQWYRLSANRD